MANCFRCGQNGKYTELVWSEQSGVGRWLCEDVDDCEATVDAQRHDYPEDIEDTPCLDEPWWRYH